LTRARVLQRGGFCGVQLGWIGLPLVASDPRVLALSRSSGLGGAELREQVLAHVVAAEVRHVVAPARSA
jgi:hypothetical protein